MKNLFKKTALGMIILVVDAFSSLGQNTGFATNFPSWNVHSQYGRSISGLSIPVVAYIDKKTKTMDKQDNRISKKFEDIAYENFREEELCDLYKTHVFCHERIPEVVSFLIKSDLQRVQAGLSLEEIAFNDSQRLATNSAFVTRFREIYNLKNDEFECKELSSTMFAAYLARKVNSGDTNSVKVALETGLIFHEEYAPKGIGHQWIRINGQLYDPSIRADLGFRYMNEKGYIPIIITEMTLKSNRAMGNTQIGCFPKKIEDKIKEQIKDVK